MSNHNRGLSIDASYQISVHLAKTVSAEMNLDPLSDLWFLTLFAYEK
jgi:hypothetical protein